MLNNFRLALSWTAIYSSTADRISPTSAYVHHLNLQDALDSHEEGDILLQPLWQRQHDWGKMQHILDNPTTVTTSEFIAVCRLAPSESKYKLIINCARTGEKKRHIEAALID